MAKRLVQNTQLATTFTDWDYHQADKDRCQLKKDGSFLLGGYMQIPRLAVSLVMTTSLGVDGEGADAPWKDFEMLRTQRRTWNVGRGGLALQMATKCQHGSGTTHAFRYDFFFRLAIPASPPPSAVVYGDHQPSPGLDEFKTLDRHFRIRNQWTNVPVSAGALATGTYLVQFKNVDIHAVGVYAETFSAVMSWRSGGTNANDASELVNFHSAGHARNNVKFKLRFKESGWQGPWEGLQIWCSHDTPAAQVYTVVFKRMI